jgi:squalene-hopene/tetraprenyl-beta-curcumene cyclase
MLLFRRRTIPTGLALAALIAFAPLARAQDADEAMLTKGIAFLMKTQGEDGSFGAPPGKPGEIGFTAMIARAFADYCSAHPKASEAEARAKDKAIAWLVKQQKEDGSFTPDGTLATYRTGLAVLALAADDKAKNKDAITKAEKWLETAQFSEDNGVGADSPHYGGWNYGKTGKPDADLSNAQFAIAALHEAGVVADSKVMKRALEFVTHCQNDTEANKGVKETKLVPKNDGGFYYGPSRPTAPQTKIENADGTVSYESYASMTYAGLLSMLSSGLSKDDGRVKAALGWIKQHYTLDENSGLGVRATDPKQAQMGLYYYYFTFSRALHALGSDEIETKEGSKHWGRDLLDALKARQKPDGSWTNDAEAKWMEGNPVLATAYAVSAANLALKHRGEVSKK